MKRLLRAMLAEGCRALGATSRTERSIRDRLVILCYHRVLPAEQKAAYFQPDLVVTPEALREYCRALADRYEVLPLREAWAAMRSGARRDRPLATLTFDDGYRDNHRYAAPTLATFNMKATFFVVSDLVGGARPPWYDRMGKAFQSCAVRAQTKHERGKVLRVLESALKSDSPDELPAPYRVVALAKSLPSPAREALTASLEELARESVMFGPDDLIMNAAELGELARAGHEIGSHTRSHPILPMVDDGELRDELAGSRSALETMIGKPVTSFCYPNGDFDGRVERAVSEAGYECAAAVQSGMNSAKDNPFGLRRRFMHEDRLRGASGGPSSALLRMELCGLADRVFRRRRAEVAPA